MRLLQPSRANVCLWKKSVCNDEHFRLIILISVSISPETRYAAPRTKRTFWNSRNTITDGRLDSACCQSLKRNTMSNYYIYLENLSSWCSHKYNLSRLSRFFSDRKRIVCLGTCVKYTCTWLWFMCVEVFNIVSTNVEMFRKSGK